MNSKTKIELLSDLGTQILSEIDSSKYKEIINLSKDKNPWFTKSNVKNALTSIARLFLNYEKLNKWVKKYDINETKQSKKIGLTLAGNIPLVGFHDVLCVFMSNNISVIKMSSKDKVLLTFLLNELYKLNPDSERYFEIIDERLKNFDAIIATGSNNSARYFEYYFKKYPNIIRKNRNSIAILNGKENPEQINNLGKDIFSFFGLGCRNVSKIFVPENYNFDNFLKNINNYEKIIDHYKYANNYTYNKGIFMINSELHFDNGFLLLKENTAIASPLSVLFYEKYKNINELKKLLEIHSDEIQLIVSDEDYNFETIKFGTTQEPELWDYSDNIDTMDFLTNIK